MSDDKKLYVEYRGIKVRPADKIKLKTKRAKGSWTAKRGSD